MHFIFSTNIATFSCDGKQPIIEIKIHVYAKWQMSDSSWEILRIENNQIKSVQNNWFLCIKLAWNYLFFSWSNKNLTTIKGRAWSHGTNSRLLFGVNVNLNLSKVKGSYSSPLHQPAIRVSPFACSISGYLRMILHEMSKILLSMCCMLRRCSIEPRPNSWAHGTSSQLRH